VIRVESLSKSFDGKAVLEDVSLEIHEGETLAIIGRSGSGKSVLLKNIIGLLRPDAGAIVVDGVDLHRLPYDELRAMRQRFGVLFQGGALFDSMTALENVAFPVRTFSSMSHADATRRAQECLDLVQLSGAGSKRANELSGGQQKRVALARAIALEPKYLFYDEPTSGLDPQTSLTIDQLIVSLAERLRVTSILVSHDIHSVLRVADRACFIHDGRLRWVGTIDEMHRSTDETLLSFVRANEYRIGSWSGEASPTMN
jgi:phospholipid/cholesterol/gamma-HCH transport system ATP-binding protein